jgi:hypothetical protein
MHKKIKNCLTNMLLKNNGNYILMLIDIYDQNMKPESATAKYNNHAKAGAKSCLSLLVRVFRLFRGWYFLTDRMGEKRHFAKNLVLGNFSNEDVKNICEPKGCG